MVCRHVHPAHRFLDWWYSSPVLGPASVHEYVNWLSLSIAVTDGSPLVWPANLVNAALFNTLHSQRYAGMGTRGGISRERFFTYGFLASCAWYFFPGYIFQALSVFSWVTWIAPNNIVSLIVGDAPELPDATPL